MIALLGMLLIMWMLIAFFLLIVGVPEDAALPISVILLGVFIIGAIVYTWYRLLHTRPFKGGERAACVVTLRSNITNNPLLNQQYEDALKLSTLEIKSIIPSLHNLKLTHFGDYYKWFYKTKEDMAVLYVMAKNPLAEETKHPLNKEIMKYVDVAGSDEKLLTAYPWLIRVEI